MADTRIGFIGLGIMGLPMARNLHRAGYMLNLHTRTRDKAEVLLREGAVWMGSCAEVAQASDALISMVPDSPDVIDVYLGRNGVCTTLRPGTLCIDMSTVSPTVACQVAQAVERCGGAFLDAPVSGGKTGAEAATLSIMAGGAARDLERSEPLFHALGKAVIHCGPVGHGQLTKLCNQILCGLNLLAVSEAIVFAREVGLDPEIMLKAVSGGAAASWALSNLGPRMLARDFAPMFMIDLQQKDLRIALGIAQEHKVPLLGTSMVSQLLTANQAALEGRDGTQALLKTLERLAHQF